MAEDKGNDTWVWSEKTADEILKTAVAPQKTAMSPQKTAVVAQKTALAPQNTSAASASGSSSEDIPAAHAPGETVSAGGKSYTVEKRIGGGTEADIYLVSDKKKKYALKLFRKGYRTNAKIVPALRKLEGKGYVADLVDYGDKFELTEFIPCGNAASAGIKGNARAILAVAVKTAMSLDRLHKEGVIHKDIKPGNILIKDSGSYDCVLCDFGIADVLGDDGKCATLQVRTPIYAAPEVYSDTVTLEDGIYSELTPKADFYSLGMTILSLWMGESAFFSKESRMAIDKVKGRMTVPADMPDPLARICRGLLIKNPAKRWDLPEIERTLAGETVPVEEDEIIEDLNIVFSASKHLVAHTPEELAQCMWDDTDLAVKYLYRGQIEKWLKPYPELALEIQEIVETRYPKDQSAGVTAAIFVLDPLTPFPLTGISRKTGETVMCLAATFKDFGNFCSEAIPNDKTLILVTSDSFVEWVRSRDKAAARNLPSLKQKWVTFALRVQALDPMSDINLINDPSDGNYAMTQEKIGCFLNKVYNIYWGRFKGSADTLIADWNKSEYAPLNREMSIHTILNIAVSFEDPDDSYLVNFFDIKGDRFRKQKSWFLYCMDRKSKEYLSKAGPKDYRYNMQTSWMKVIKGFGYEPEYEFAASGKTVKTIGEAFSRKKSELKEEYENGGLMGWLAVQHHEDPHADLSAPFAYEKRLHDYLSDLRKIDGGITPVKRFDYARKEADRILSSGKNAIRRLNVRNALQYAATVLLAVVPALMLLVMLIFSIVENPLIDTSGMYVDKFFWTIGLIVAAGIYFLSDMDGCLLPIIGGLIVSMAVLLVVKMLGAVILYVFAAAVIAAIVFFSIKTLFSRSRFAAMARKFTRPGFEEKVLEPLYHAFNTDTNFDSSLNGAFNDYEIRNWKTDIKRRRIYVLLFIAAVWVLAGLSVLVPKSERFDRYTRPLVEKVMRVRAVDPEPPVPDLLQSESLEPGSKGEEVAAMQNYLKEEGFLKGAVDGDYGTLTRNAVKAFQKAFGLPETGVADRSTIETINKSAAVKQQTQNSHDL